MAAAAKKLPKKKKAKQPAATRRNLIRLIRKLKTAPRLRKLPKKLPQPKSQLVIEARAFQVHVRPINDGSSKQQPEKWKAFACFLDFHLPDRIVRYVCGVAGPG